MNNNSKGKNMSIIIANWCPECNNERVSYDERDGNYRCCSCGVTLVVYTIDGVTVAVLPETSKEEVAKLIKEIREEEI